LQDVKDMRVKRRIQDSAPREFVEIGPKVAVRMPLAQEPSAATVGTYVLTRGAGRAWEAINNHLAGTAGALFWIAGAAGAGKTHFLNYVSALSARAGALSAEVARYLTLPLEIADDDIAGAEIERRLLMMVATTLAGEDHSAALWHQMRGAEAMIMALDRAHRQGVKGITIALDLGLGESAAANEILVMLAKIARASTNLRLIVVAAGRREAPAGSLVFDVTAQTGEEILVAVGRARRLDDSALRKVDALYRNLDDSPWDPRAIYPLHPAAAIALQALQAPGDGVGVLAAAVREVIEPWHVERDFNRLIVPAALMRSAIVRRAVDARLGEAGCTARKIATAAAAIVTNGESCEIFRLLIDTLVLNHLSGSAATLALDQIRARLGLDDDASGAGAELMESIAALAARTRGVIVYDAQARTARFDPHGASAPEVAGFNNALALACRFDSTLTTAQDLSEVTNRIERLDEAMAIAIEDACCNRDTLVAAMGESNARLSTAQQQAFIGIIELAESGPAGLIEAGASRVTRDTALATIAAYDNLAVVAGAVPRLKLMRNYLEGTSLTSGYNDEADRDRDLVELETECQMLMAAVTPAMLAGGGRNLDALEARFHKFKWTYVQHYRAAHERLRAELERLGPMAHDVRRYLEALRRLNAIAMLGPSEGAEVAIEMATLDGRLSPCGSALAPEVTPCCTQCGFRLGTMSPHDAINSLFARARRAIEIKLAALSQHAIARLIRQHDLNHRLEGFLKIIQAAQTDALIGVLDDQLADYLARLLDENAAVDIGSVNLASSHVKGRNLRAPALRRSKIDGRNGRSGRADKAPPDNS
jgi:hypothetical protein